MNQTIDLTTNLLSLLTIAGGGISLFLLITNIFLKSVVKIKWFKIFVSFISKNALSFSLIVAMLATLGSLFYSEIAKFEPCKLCWFQRIFMYPQTVLLAIAAAKNDKRIISYLLPLNVIGGALAAYHYYIQVNPNPYLPCSAVGYSSGCSQNFILRYGYITIPMMALTAFSMITLFLITSRRLKK